MGGNAIIIDGDVDLERVTRRSLLGRLFRAARPSETAADDRRHVDLPASGFQSLGDDFKAYVRGRCSKPWPSTKYIMDYLDIGIRVFLRGDRGGGTALSWYVQITFPGCAGMAETSSELAAHWASRWYQDEGAAIGRLLVDKGFAPRALRSEAGDGPTFLPVSHLGYAAYSDVGMSSESDEEHTHFQIDASARESTAEVADELLVALESRFRDVMTDGSCRCQLCNPDFNLDSLKGLPGLE